MNDWTDVSFWRSFRVGPFTLFDSILAFGAVFLLSPWLSALFARLGLPISRTGLLLLVLPVGVLAHRLVGVETPLTMMFFDPNGYWMVKILLVLMVGVVVGQIMRERQRLQLSKHPLV